MQEVKNLKRFKTQEIMITVCSNLIYIYNILQILQLYHKSEKLI